jgi:fibrillarin-like rRNA methylase
VIGRRKMQDRDFEYFLQNMERFFVEYGHKFIVIKNQSILGVYEDFDEALENTLKTEEVGSFLIQECFDDKEKMVHHFQGNVMPIPA